MQESIKSGALCDALAVALCDAIDWHSLCLHFFSKAQRVLLAVANGCCRCFSSLATQKRSLRSDRVLLCLNTEPLGAIFEYSNCRLCAGIRCSSLAKRPSWQVLVATLAIQEAHCRQSAELSRSPDDDGGQSAIGGRTRSGEQNQKL